MDLLKQHKVGRQNREITVEDVTTQFLDLIFYFFKKNQRKQNNKKNPKKIFLKSLRHLQCLLLCIRLLRSYFLKKKSKITKELDVKRKKLRD